jgi:hypothetical protein
MSLADVPRGALSAGAFLRPARATVGDSSPGKCPFPHQTSDSLQAWLEGGLQCAAGKREFRLGRYQVSRVRTGRDYALAMAEFRGHVAEHSKTGFLAIFADETRCDSVADELKLLGAAMRDAGMTDDPDGIVAGKTLATAMEVACPVTGKDTIYEFFSVAFCRNAANPRDPLYDPSLSAPFLAVNTTSDAFAFARVVQDQAMRVWGRPVYEMKHDRDAVELLFRRCVTAWQNMSITTITNYSRVAIDPARGVHLSEDRQRWFAAHNDPVFAELKKCPFQHEMPVTYAARLTAKWSANLFDGKPYEPSRDGQSGGTPIAGGGFEDGFEVEGLSGELFQF